MRGASCIALWFLIAAAVRLSRTSVLHERIDSIEDDDDQQQSRDAKQQALQEEHEQQRINQIHTITFLSSFVMILIILENTDYARNLHDSHNFAKSSGF